MSAALECHDVHVEVRAADGGSRALLAAIDLVAPPGAITGLRGPTGSGKSTLLHVLAGLVRPTTGEVRVGEQAISRWTAAHRDLWRRRVGLMFQGAELLGSASVRENIAVPLVPQPLPAAEKRRALEAVLARLALAPLAEQPARELSGGERQRVALARALVHAPGYVLFDEPSAHQDDAHLALVLGEIRAARARGAVVVLATHDPRVVQELDDARWLRLEGGRLTGEDA